MYNNRHTSDLFCEQFGAAEPQHDAHVERISLFGIDAYRGTVSDKSPRAGDYVTVDCGPMWHASFDPEPVIRAVAEAINTLAPCTHKPPRVLVCALGNAAVAADSVGSRAADRILVLDGTASSHLPTTYLLRPGVGAATGISAARHVEAVSERLGATLVICIDALVAGTAHRLGSLVQITNVGISPGSGVSEHTESVTPRVLGIPVISLGVPTVMRAPFPDAEGELYTIAQVERLALTAGALIGGAVNLYFTKHLREEDTFGC